MFPARSRSKIGNEQLVAGIWLYGDDLKFDDPRTAARAERRTLTSERDQLHDEREQLLRTHYAGAVPLDLLKEEQDRISR